MLLQKELNKEFFSTFPGEYDKWAIKFGIHQDLTEMKEIKFLLDLLSQN